MLLTGNNLIAQEIVSKKGSVNFGFETGLQVTGISDIESQIVKSKLGFNAGPLLEYYLSNNVKFRIALHFDNRSFSMESTLRPLVIDTLIYSYDSYYHEKENFKVNYLTIPLSLIYIKGSDKFKLYIQGTVYYSFLINSTQSGFRDVYISENDAPHYYFENYPEFNTPGHHYLEQDTQKFNSGDIGINMFFGAIYYVKPGIGISFSPGLSYAFSNVWEDPTRIATWSTLYKFTFGLVYSVK